MNLCYFAYNYVKDRQISEDIISDMFMNLWEKRKSIVITGGVKPYLYTSVKNRSLNYLRNNRIHFEMLDSVDQLTLTMLGNPEEKVNYDELKNVIDGLIDSLPGKRKLIFQMSRFDELTYKEIAEILSISESTVKNQMMKAVQFMNAHYPVLKRTIANS
jgi:RNA polymerase sigma-70 factor, ECF subfamily